MTHRRVLSALLRPHGVLPVLSALLLASAVLRLLGHPEIAQAFASAAAPAQCAPDSETAGLMSALQERARRISEQEGILADRARAQDLAQKTIEARLTELTQAEQKLASTVAFADTAAENDITRLVAVYENMKPREAAQIFQSMEPDFAAGFLARMRPESAAAVMASLDPKFAYSVSVVVAGRNAAAPRN